MHHQVTRVAADLLFKALLIALSQMSSLRNLLRLMMSHPRHTTFTGALEAVNVRHKPDEDVGGGKKDKAVEAVGVVGLAEEVQLGLAKAGAEETGLRLEGHEPIQSTLTNPIIIWAAEKWPLILLLPLNKKQTQIFSEVKSTVICLLRFDWYH